MRCLFTFSLECSHIMAMGWDSIAYHVLLVYIFIYLIWHKIARWWSHVAYITWLFVCWSLTLCFCKLSALYFHCKNNTACVIVIEINTTWWCSSCYYILTLCFVTTFHLLFYIFGFPWQKGEESIFFVFRFSNKKGGSKCLIWLRGVVTLKVSII